MRGRMAVLVVATAATLVSLVVAYDGRVAAGVRVAGIALGGLTGSEARTALVDGTRDAAVHLWSDAGVFTFDGGAGIEIDVDATMDGALGVGRRGDLWARAVDVAGAAAVGREVPLVRRVADAERFERTIELVAANVERDVADARVAIEGDTVSWRSATTGIALDRAALVDAVLGAGAVSARTSLPLRLTSPSLDDDAAAPAYDEARNAGLPLVLGAGTERFVIEPARLLPLVRIEREPGADGDRLAATLDPRGLDALVNDAADALDGPVREAVLVPGGDRYEVLAGRDGVVVDRGAAWSTLAGAIFGTERVQSVAASITHPALSTQAAQRVADTTVLAGGYTTYFPINAARATNIGRAARTFDGMTVAPGESFSFWQRLGEVTGRTGYVLAGTIIGGVSSEAIGGGLCQVSTTFFNAVAAAGYAIDERHPHSYYIERYPLGRDAAVFAPSTDMRWTNDTPYPATVRASGTDTSVSFWIYSAPTGRTTAFGEPLQWNVVWPSPSQPADPGHVPGYVVPGRDTSVTRTVTANGAIVHQDTWYSHYAPVWGGPAR